MRSKSTTAHLSCRNSYRVLRYNRAFKACHAFFLPVLQVSIKDAQVTSMFRWPRNELLIEAILFEVAICETNFILEVKWHPERKGRMCHLLILALLF